MFNEMIQQLRQVQRSLNYEFQSDSALRNKIISSCNNIPACSVAILQQTSTIAGLINNIYAAIENSEEAMKAEKAEPLGLPTTYFTDRKYHTNRPQSINRPPSNNNRFSSSSNNGFQRKLCFICGKPGCWSTKHSEKERQEAKNKYAKRVSNSFEKRYDSYVQELEGLEEQDEKDPLDIEALALDIQDTDLEEAENFVTIISAAVSARATANLGSITPNQPNITSPAPIYGSIHGGSALTSHPTVYKNYNLYGLNQRIPHLLPSPHQIFDRFEAQFEGEEHRRNMLRNNKFRKKQCFICGKVGC